MGAGSNSSTICYGCSVRTDRKSHLKTDKKAAARSHKRGIVGYNKKSALLEDAITQMNAGKYGRSSAALKELLALDPHNMEARRLFATLHLRLGSLIPARQAFDSLVDEAFERQDFWLAESLLREYLAAGPRCVPYLEKLGSVYERKGNASEAAAEYGKAIDILIEDPDPENPHHASQLYAKIKELAPAGPVAFRLARFFDANTGELVVPPPAAPVEGAMVTPSPVGIEAVASTLCVSEPISPAAPWEQPADSPGPSPTAQAWEPISYPELPGSEDGPSVPSEGTWTVDDRPAELDLSKEETTEDTIAVRPDNQPGTQEEESKVSPLEPSAAIDAAGLASGDANKTATSSVTPEVAPNTAAADITVEAPATLREPEWRRTAETEFMSSPVPVDEHDSPSPHIQHIQQESGREPIAAPMPWEEVLESIIAIPNISNQPSDAVHAAADQVEGRLPAAPSEPPSSLSAPDELREGAPTAPVTEEPAQTHEPLPIPSSNNEIAEATKPGRFSWESLFSTAWKFREKPASSEARVEGAQLNTSQIEEPPPSAMTSSQPDLSEGESVDNGQAAPVKGTPEADASSVVAPMPWEHVLDSTVTIPSSETQEAEIDHPLGQPGQSERGVEQPLALPQEGGMAQPEPEFRVVGSAPLTAVQEERHANTEVAPTSLAVSESDEAVRPVGPDKPAHADVSSGVPVTEPRDPAGLSAAIAMVLDSSEATPVPLSDAVSGETLSGSITSLRTGVKAEPSPTPGTTVQTFHPSSKKRKVTPAADFRISETPGPLAGDAHRLAESHQRGEAAFGEAEASQRFEPAPLQQQPQEEERIDAGETIRFIDEPKISVDIETASQSTLQATAGGTRAMSTAAAAVDVLFDSSGAKSRRGTWEQVVETKTRPKRRSSLRRIGTRISTVLGSCLSTTRSIVMSLVALVVLAGALVALTIGALGLTWIIMEKAPSAAFQNLTSSPQRTLADFRKNGYFLLLGFDVSEDQDPIYSGYERKADQKDADMALACLGGIGGSRASGPSSASASVVGEWFRGPNPVGQFKAHQDAITAWVSKAESSISRYKQWQRLSFEDWGYGQTISPPCGSILFAHQLYIAEGFLQGTDVGIDRIETDMEAWRMVLGQAKTLPVKTLANQAINDNIAVASGLLVQPNFDGRYLGRLTRMLRPFDQVELSIRWPMQSELVSAATTFDVRLKAERREEQSLAAAVASVLPLPKQRRLNAYADYYEASYKAAGEGRHGALPKWKNYIQFPAVTLMDYFTNPIENIVGLEPLAPWDLYNGLVVDTDARLRLASLQAWLRRGPQDGDLLVRIAKAGQKFYDPYTGLPMLVNAKKGLMYSVGHDGKDQDGDPQTDVVAAIPLHPGVPESAKNSSGFPKPK
jgi:hypothetical protein